MTQIIVNLQKKLNKILSWKNAFDQNALLLSKAISIHVLLFEQKIWFWKVMGQTFNFIFNITFF